MARDIHGNEYDRDAIENELLADLARLATQPSPTRDAEERIISRRLAARRAELKAGREAEKRLAKSADFSVSDQGTVVVFLPLSPAAQKWLSTHVQAEPWQFFGRALAIDHRYAQPLLQGIAEAGLSVC